MRLTRFHFAVAATLVLLALTIVWRSIALGIATALALVITIGLGVAFPQLRLFGPFICWGAGDQKRVALTFDDGPEERSTPALLELLRERGVRVAATPALLELLRERGVRVAFFGIG